MSNIPKSRGALAKALEKYVSLAQDAFSNGDRIVAENFYQYAEHYQRLLNEEFGFEQKKQINDGNMNDAGNGKADNFSTAKPSRTQRAINAKNDKLNNENSEKSENLQKVKKENFTSDGIEALKPFEASLNEEKPQSS